MSFDVRTHAHAHATTELRHTFLQVSNKSFIQRYIAHQPSQSINTHGITGGTPALSESRDQINPHKGKKKYKDGGTAPARGPFFDSGIT